MRSHPQYHDGCAVLLPRLPWGIALPNVCVLAPDVPIYAQEMTLAEVVEVYWLLQTYGRQAMAQTAGIVVVGTNN